MVAALIDLFELAWKVLQHNGIDPEQVLEEAERCDE